jgi:hypothetical protein
VATTFHVAADAIVVLCVCALLKGQGSYNLVQSIGHKETVSRPRCIGPGRAQTQILFYSILLCCATWEILCYQKHEFDIHGSVHRRWFNRNTNKMQLCNRIYYCTVYWRHVFREAHRSSSGALNCVCSLWFIYPCGDRPLPRLSGKWISHSALTTAGHNMCI